MYQEIVLENDTKVLPALIDSLKTSAFQMDSKLAMIKSFLPKIKF